MRFSQLVCLIIFLSTVATAQTGKVCGKITLKRQALEGVTVTLEAAQNDRTAAIARSSFITRTNSDGGYCFANVPPGRHAVVAQALGYALPGTVDSSRPARIVVVSEGGALSDIDLDFLPGAVISGRITNRNGQPYISLPVDIVRKASNGNFENVRLFNFQMRQTDDRGVFRIFGLAPGSYVIGAGVPREGSRDTLNAGPPQLFYPGKEKREEAAIIELKEGEERTDINLELGDIPNERFDVAGRMVDASTGQALSNLQFGVLKIERGHTFTAAVSTTSNTGEFRAQGLVPGRYKIALHIGRDSRYYAEPEIFEVVDQDVAGLEVKGLPGSSIAGRVTVDGNSDAIRELLQSGSFISASPAGSGNPDIPFSSPQTLEPDGSFKIGGLAPGNWLLSSNTNSPLQLARIEVGGIPVSDNFSIEPGKSVTGVLVIYRKGRGRITGVVKILGGKVPQELAISINATRIIKPGEPQINYNSKSVLCDSDMRFAIEGLVQGEYRLYAGVTGLTGSSTFNLPIPAIDPPTVTVAENSAEVTITFDLGKRGSKQ